MSSLLALAKVLGGTVILGSSIALPIAMAVTSLSSIDSPRPVTLDPYNSDLSTVTLETEAYF